MARVNCPASVTVGPWPTAGVLMTETAADASNLNETPFSGKFIVIARNSGASPRTVTISSVADAQQQRSGDITTEALAAGTMKHWGPFSAEGFRQSGGVLHFAGSHAEVKFSVIRIAQ